MKKIVDHLEFLIFIASICVISAGILGLYLKVFDMAPPLPGPVVHLPVMLLMSATLVVRLREATFGVLSTLPYLFIGLLALASFKWSQQPDVTLREGVIALLYTVYLATMAWRFSWRKLVEGMWIALLGMVVFSLFLYVAVPSLGRMSETHVGALSGLWIEKNATGQIGVFGAGLALARMAMSPKTFMTSAMSFLIFTVFLILSTSKTSLVAYLVVCAGFGWVYLMRRSLPMAGITLITSIMTGGLLVTWLRTNYAEVLGLLGRSSTFTGRSEIWQSVQFSLADRPLLGHGYSGYWGETFYGRTLAYVYDDLQFMPQHAHNSIIEMKLTLGWVGASVMIAAIGFYLLVTLLKVRKSHGSYFAIPFTFAALIIGMFESVLANPANFAGAVIILVASKAMRPVLHEERQSSFWEIVNSFRMEGQGPVRHKPIPGMATQLGFHSPSRIVERRRSPIQERRHRRNFHSPEAIWWRLHNRRRNRFSYS